MPNLIATQDYRRSCDRAENIGSTCQLWKLFSLDRCLFTGKVPTNQPNTDDFR
ncbi:MULTISPECIES: hypothetical protein [unclassified Chamaesiphon]|uniref:hypothetical protein n=1 Tax=unclassified Chamaesiphon TaxID=2620921 RepID=UPI00286B026B|nr:MULTISPECIES: hypothetical protein [unclassified Chamaesiphon]